MQAKQLLTKGLHMVQVSTNCPKHGVITREVVNIIADTARHTCPKCQADKEQAEKQARIEIRHQQIATQSGITHYKTFDAWQANNERMANILSFAQNYTHHPKANLIFSGSTQMIQRLGDRAWDRLQQNAVFIAFNWQSYRQVHSNFVEI